MPKKTTDPFCYARVDKVQAALPVLARLTILSRRWPLWPKAVAPLRQYLRWAPWARTQGLLPMRSSIFGR